MEVKGPEIVPSSDPIENGDIKETKLSTPDVPSPKSDEDVLSPKETTPQIAKAVRFARIQIMTLDLTFKTDRERDIRAHQRNHWCSEYQRTSRSEES